MLAAAINAADPFVNFQNYSRVMVVFPPNNACSFAGLGSLGCWGISSPGDGAFTASVAWNRSDQMANRGAGVQLLTHEGGHNLTMRHASSRDFGAEELGPVGDVGTLNEYGDIFSTMGSWNFGLYSAKHAVEQLGWLAPVTNYQVVETTGTRTIQNYERRPAGLKALKVRRGTGNDAWLWIEYRQNTGMYDAYLSSQVWSGVLIHYQDSVTGTYTHLLDFYQPSLDNWTNVALPAGSAWTDPYSNLSISVSNATSSSVDVTVTYAPNDNYSNATEITSRTYTSTVTTTGYTTEGTDPTPACGNGSRSKSAWYRFTPTVSGMATVDTFGSSYNTILSAYTGTPGSFVQIACNDDTGGPQSQISFAVTAGTTYSVMVSAYDSDGGTLTVHVSYPYAGRRRSQLVSD